MQLAARPAAAYGFQVAAGVVMGWLNNLLGAEPAPDVIVTAPPMPRDLDFVVIDVETACSRASSICQVGIVGFQGGASVFEFDALLDPNDDFDPFNVRLHGISAAHVCGKPHFGHYHATLVDYLGGRAVVAHSSFDRSALIAACENFRKPAIEARWVDSVAVARRVWPDLPNHKLNTLARYLSIDLRHHDALSDARAAGMIMVHAMAVTGASFEEIVAAPRPPKKSVPAARGVGDGPLTGHCIAMTGEMSVPKNRFADEIAAAGGEVASGVSKKTTVLVLGVQDPTTFAGKPKSAKHTRAEELIAAGLPIQIMDEAAFRAMMRN